MNFKCKINRVIWIVKLNYIILVNLTHWALQFSNPTSLPPAGLPAIWNTVMPGLLSPDGKESLVPFNLDLQKPSIHTLPHGLRPSLFRIHISWSRGNCLHVTCLRPPNEDGEGCGGKIAAVTLGGGEGGDLSDAQMRRVAYGSVPAFALLQSQKNVDIQLPRMVADTVRSQWLVFNFFISYDLIVFWRPGFRN